MECLVKYLAFAFLNNKRLWLILHREPFQVYPVNASVLQGSFLLLLYINDLPPNNVKYNIGIYADYTSVYSKCDQASDLWQQLELASELELDLQNT